MGIENFFKKKKISKEIPKEEIIKKYSDQTQGGEIQRKKKFSKEKQERHSKKILDKAQKMRQGEETQEESDKH